LNTIKDLDISIDGAWADVQVQYQRRADLIPNLVNTVKGFADQELGVFTEVTELRTKATSINVNIEDPASLQQFAAAQSELSQGLGKLLAIAENYPDLKSNENFLDLQKQLEGTENRIAVAISRFNGAVGAYEKYRKNIPQSFIIERFSDYGERGEFFQAEERAQTAPVVDFGDDEE
jgi:LemA protein